MELHRALTFLGAVLLVATLVTYYGGAGGSSSSGLALVTGIAMLAAFAASFVLFNIDRWDDSKGRAGRRARRRQR